MRQDKIISQSVVQTKEVAKNFCDTLRQYKNKPAVIALNGNLGAGKTTFAQGFAAALGVKEKITSPTFVLLKIYALPPRTVKKIGKRHLVHADCYRISSAKEMLHLGLKNFFSDRDAVVLVEWADRIRKLLFKDTVWIRFSHGKNLAERKIIIENSKSFRAQRRKPSVQLSCAQPSKL